MARTVDNLGLDASQTYAENKSLYEEWLIKDARTIPSQTKVTTTEATFKSEFEEVLDVGPQQILRASIKPPPNYTSSRRRLFAPEGLIPSLGSPQTREAQIERIQAMGLPDSEKEVMLNLLNLVHTYNQLAVDINVCRAQTQKG